MNVYVDSSVLLRVVLGERGRLRIWPRITTAVSSDLIRLEALRTVDRAQIRAGLSDAEVAARRADILQSIEAIQLVALDPLVLERAADPFPTMVGSLDAIHLASALFAREAIDDLAFATHDTQLAIAARSMGFDVHGVDARAMA